MDISGISDLKIDIISFGNGFVYVVSQTENGIVKLYAKHINSDPSPVVSYFNIGDSNGYPGSSNSVVIEILASGSLVVAWDIVGASNIIYVQVLDNSFNPIHSPYQMNANGSYPALAALSEGGFAILYKNNEKLNMINFSICMNHCEKCPDPLICEKCVPGYYGTLC